MKRWRWFASGIAAVALLVGGAFVSLHSIRADLPQPTIPSGARDDPQRYLQYQADTAQYETNYIAWLTQENALIAASQIKPYCALSDQTTPCMDLPRVGLAASYPDPPAQTLADAVHQAFLVVKVRIIGVHGVDLGGRHASVATGVANIVFKGQNVSSPLAVPFDSSIEPALDLDHTGAEVADALTDPLPLPGATAYWLIKSSGGSIEPWVGEYLINPDGTVRAPVYSCAGQENEIDNPYATCPTPGTEVSGNPFAASVSGLSQSAFDAQLAADAA